MINNIGIIGYGFVGQAIAFGFSPVVPIYVYDKDPNRCINSLEETVNDSDIIFVSVPTPMRKDGSIDLSIVYSVFESISEVNKRNNNIFIIKSTVVPGTTTELSEKFPDLNIIFNPETYLAEVHIAIENSIQIPDDSIASIRTSGRIGDKFLKISPGGSDNIIEPNMIISETEPSINLEELISKYIFESGK